MNTDVIEIIIIIAILLVVAYGLYNWAKEILSGTAPMQHSSDSHADCPACQKLHAEAILAQQNTGIYETETTESVINPASGLPILGDLNTDIDGNPYGTS